MLKQSVHENQDNFERKNNYQEKKQTQMNKISRIFRRLYSHQKISQELIEPHYEIEKPPPDHVSSFPIPKYGGEHIVTLLTGSAVGQQGSSYIQQIFEHVHAPIMFEQLCTQKCNNLPMTTGDAILKSVARNRVCINIDVQHDIERKHESLKMNNALDLYACVVNCQSFCGFNSNRDDIDIAIISQNNVGDFSKLEYEPVNGLVKTLKICSDKNVRRIIHFAFKYAQKNQREKLTFVHKSDQIPLTDGLFIKVAKEIHQAHYRDLEFETMLVNHVARKIITQPEKFDVIVSNEKYGTMLTSIAAAVCGGPTLFCACEIGDDHAVFKPLETKLSINTDGEKLLNPYGTIMAGIQLLYHLKFQDCGSLIYGAVENVMENMVRTKDHGGDYREVDVINEILIQLGNRTCQF